MHQRPKWQAQVRGAFLGVSLSLRNAHGSTNGVCLFVGEPQNGGLSFWFLFKTTEMEGILKQDRPTWRLRSRVPAFSPCSTKTLAEDWKNRTRVYPQKRHPSMALFSFRNLRLSAAAVALPVKRGPLPLSPRPPPNVSWADRGFAPPAEFSNRGADLERASARSPVFRRRAPMSSRWSRPVAQLMRRNSNMGDVFFLEGTPPKWAEIAKLPGFSRHSFKLCLDNSHGFPESP